ncbi:MAG: DUF3108 domain-containing protein [Candidatus Cloacimonetes bacterium]|nr:DUF3108 domain-containing protein [Candidatus Cloacimonadota bacterium]
MTNNHINKILITTLLLLVILNLYSEKLYFDIEYVGISVAKVEFEKTNNEIQIKAKSGKLANFFSISFDNRYYIKCDGTFRPIEYTKAINQKKFLENSVIVYNHQNLNSEYYCSASDIYLKYPITETTRDFFSALYYLRNNNLSNNFHIDAAGILWDIQSEFVNQEIINTAIGKLDVNKIKIRFKKLNPDKYHLNTQKLKSDILTNNLVNEDNLLYFWFTNDEKKIPVKAQYLMSPFNVNWTIQKIED